MVLYCYAVCNYVGFGDGGDIVYYLDVLYVCGCLFVDD